MGGWWQTTSFISLAELLSRVAVHLLNTPYSEFLFINSTSSTPTFHPEPQPFQRSLSATDKTYNVLNSFLLPPINEGEYTFYAFFVEAGTNPLEKTDISRSNRACNVSSYSKYCTTLSQTRI